MAKLIALLIAVLLTTSPSLSQRQGGRRVANRMIMNETQKKAIELLKLRDEQYFDAGNELVLQLQQKLGAIAAGAPLSKPPSAPPREALPVLALGVPEAVNLDTRREIPVLVATQQNGQRRWEVNYEQNLHLLVIDLHTGKVHKGQPLFDNRAGEFEPSKSGNPPDAINTATIISSVRRFNLFERIEPVIHPTRIALTAINYDWVSNTKVVTLRSNVHENEPITTREPSPFITSVAGQAAPKLTGDPRAALIVPTKVAASEPITVQVTISIDPGRVVMLPARETGRSLLLATLLLLKLDDMNPPLIELAVPIRNDSMSAGTVTSSFSVDLRAALGGRELSGKYQTYLIIGDTIVGPYVMTVD